jgi:wyosine [tRNA(Phe)-imidazoG37] synthetase (radical SAM superfamily)
MVENTVVCNFKCLACDRGVVDTRLRKNGRAGGRLMSLEDIDIVSKTIHTYGIEQVCYHNLGEPFLSRDILQEMQTIRKLNPNTRIIVSTNGTFIQEEDKMQAAMLFDYIYFSIDGASQATVEKYQVGGTFKVSLENMRQLVKYRDEQQLSKPVIEWKYVVFEWNDSEEEINRAISLAKYANVDKISFYRGGMPDGKGESSRFVVSPFFSNLGRASSHASSQWRELTLRTPSNEERL